MPSPLKRPPKDALVLVTWDDIVTDGGWEKQGATESVPHQCRSVGWVVTWGARHVVLAGTLGVGDKPEDVETNNRIAIPRGCIVGCVALRATDKINKG